MSKTEDNKSIVRRYVDEVQNGHNIEALETIFSENFVDHAQTFDGLFQGIEGLRQGYAEMLRAFPDYRVEVHDLIAEGDKVVTHKTISFTHKDTFLEMPATGKHISFKVIDIFRIEDGLIAECWLQYEELQFLQQLGAIPNSKENEKIS